MYFYVTPGSEGGRACLSIARCLPLRQDRAHCVGGQRYQCSEHAKDGRFRARVFCADLNAASVEETVREIRDRDGRGEARASKCGRGRRRAERGDPGPVPLEQDNEDMLIELSELEFAAVEEAAKPVETLVEKIGKEGGKAQASHCSFPMQRRR